MKKERVRSKRGFKGFGIFILGWFVGLISTLGILLGVGYWAYTSISVKKVERWTKTNITDNQGMEDLTLKKALGIAQGLASNGSNAYTIAQLEEDFGIQLLNDSIYGINLDIIKNSSITNLKQAVDKTIDTVTFNNILSFMKVEQEGLGILNTVLEKEFTYYVYDNKLYTNKEYSTEADFDYTIEDNTVNFSNGKHTISTYNGVQSIKPRLSDLPLNTAMNSIDEATKDLQIYKILNYTRTGQEGDYTYMDGTKEVTGVIKAIAEYTVNELSDAQTVNNLYVYEIMGYKRTGEEGNYTYTNNGEEVTGILKTISGKTIADLSKDDAFENVTVAEALNYTISQGKVYNSDNQLVTGIIAKLADAKVSGLSSRINSLTVGEILDIAETDATGVVKALYSTSVEGLKTKLDTLTLGEALGVAESDASGVIKALYNSQIDELNKDVNNLQIYQIMGYTRAGSEGNYTYTNSNGTVTGIMGAIAGTTINNIGSTIETLKATDVFSGDVTILKLFTQDELKTLTLLDLPNEATNKINTVTIDYLDFWS